MTITIPVDAAGNPYLTEKVVRDAHAWMTNLGLFPKATPADPIITSQQVTELRDATNLPLMKCKEALVACGGDRAAAVEWLREHCREVAESTYGLGKLLTQTLTEQIEEKAQQDAERWKALAQHREGEIHRLQTGLHKIFSLATGMSAGQADGLYDTDSTLRAVRQLLTERDELKNALVRERDAHGQTATDYGVLAAAVGGRVDDHAGNLAKVQTMKMATEASSLERTAMAEEAERWKREAAVERGLRREYAATHRCKVCKAQWAQWEDGSWSLQSDSCDKCCDLVPMGAQMEPIGLTAELLQTVKERDEWRLKYSKDIGELEQQLRAAEMKYQTYRELRDHDTELFDELNAALDQLGIEVKDSYGQAITAEVTRMREALVAVTVEHGKRAEELKTAVNAADDLQKQVRERSAELDEANIRIRNLTTELDESRKFEAVCHCGSPVRAHTWGDGHSAVALPEQCPYSYDLDKAKEELTRLQAVIEKLTSDSPSLAQAVIRAWQQKTQNAPKRHLSAVESLATYIGELHEKLEKAEAQIAGDYQSIQTYSQEIAAQKRMKEEVQTAYGEARHIMDEIMAFGIYFPLGMKIDDHRKKYLHLAQPVSDL